MKNIILWDSFITYFNHWYPSELLPFILYSIFSLQITKNSIYSLRTSNSFQIESNKVRTKSVQTHALCVAKENALLLLLFETSFEKMASGKFRKYPEARMLFLTKIPYIEIAHGPRFLFFNTSSSHYSKLFVALVRRNILFLATRTRNLREMVPLYCHQVLTSTRFAFYHARRGKIKGIHGGGWG